MSALKIEEKTTAEMPVPAAQMPMAVPRREENQRSIRMLAGSIAPRPYDTPASMPARPCGVFS